MKTALAASFAALTVAVIIAGSVWAANHPREAGASPMAEWNHHIDQAIIDARRETRRQEIRLIAARDGDAAADLYRRCTEYPSPANPANQARCKTIIERIAREDAATAATDAKRKAGW